MTEHGTITVNLYGEEIDLRVKPPTRLEYISMVSEIDSELGHIIDKWAYSDDESQELPSNPRDVGLTMEDVEVMNEISSRQTIGITEEELNELPIDECIEVFAKVVNYSHDECVGVDG